MYKNTDFQREIKHRVHQVKKLHFKSRCIPRDVCSYNIQPNKSASRKHPVDERYLTGYSYRSGGE